MLNLGRPPHTLSPSICGGSRKREHKSGGGGGVREQGMLDPPYHKAKHNMFGLGPPSPDSSPPDPTAPWDLGGLPSLIYGPQSPFWRQGLGQALALRGFRGELPGPQSAKVRRKKGLTVAAEPERQHLVLGCAEVSVETLMVVVFPSLSLSALGIRGVY